ncbi:hypothetical protein AAC387_Pa10g0327 [Persea americana]
MLEPDPLSLGSPGWTMDNGLGKIKVLPDYFEASTPTGDCLPAPSSSLQPSDHPLRSHSRLWGRRRFRSASTMLNLFSPRFQWGSSRNSEKVELTAAELELLRTNFVNAEQRETHLKAQLEHLDELLRSARLVGYLYIRTRWAALPGEPPIDDSDVDDWLPRFVVLHGSCIFFYFQSGDISPQDSTLLSDVVELGPLPSFIQEDKQTRYSFYILTHQGLRFECSSVSKVQVGSWLAALRNDCNLESDSTSKDPIKS